MKTPNAQGKPTAAKRTERRRERLNNQQHQNEAACGGSDLTAELDAQRATVQAQLDEAMAALQRYSRINGVRKSDVARASLGPALLKKRLDDIEAQIAAFNV